MIVYNVTISISEEIEQEWIAWMKETHIPRVMETGCFTGNKFLKLLTDRPDHDGLTYAVQYFAHSISEMNTYVEQHASRLQQEHMTRFPNQFAAFRTVLEEV